MWRSYHSYPHSSCLKSWMSWRKRILMAMSAFLYSTSQQYICVCRRGIIPYLENQSVCPLVRIGSPRCSRPFGTKGEATLACGRGGGKANSDELKESLALCLLCGVCCARFCLAPGLCLHMLSIGQEKEQLEVCVYCTLAEHRPGKGAAKDLCLHYNCWALARKRGS